MKIILSLGIRTLLLYLTPFVSMGFQSTGMELQSRNEATLTVEVFNGKKKLLEGINSAAILAIQEGLYDTIKHITAPENPIVFEDVPIGSYLVAVEHEDPYYWLPTYYGDEVEWIRADTLKLISDSVIHIQNYELGVDLGGVGVIDLTVEEGFDGPRKRAKQRICYLKRRRLDDDSFDPFRPISFGRTDANGEFQWQHIPDGTYKISVEYPGLEGFLQFEINEDDFIGNCAISPGISAYVTENGIEIELERILALPCLGLNRTSHQKLIFYPNPVQDQLNVELPNGLPFDQIELLDLTGKVVWKNSIPDLEANMIIQTSSFPTGTYVLRAKSSNKLYMTDRIIID